MYPPPRPRLSSFRLGLLILSVVALTWLTWPLVQHTILPTAAQAPVEVNKTEASMPNGATPSATPSQTQETKPPEPDDGPVSFKEGVLLLAVQEGNNFHLFAYHPAGLSLTRLTNGEWDDVAPAINPAGTKVAFASNRGGQWDLYVLTVETGAVDQVTNTPEYDGNPSWSPDGMWLAFETYQNGNLDIAIQPVDGSQEPMQLTNERPGDFEPAWAPGGRQIAFVSTRSGDTDIWLADLDNIDNRFVNLSRTMQRVENSPRWSPDGRWLLWTGVEDGSRGIYIWDNSQPDEPARYLGVGDQATWSPDGSQVAVRLEQPNQTYLTAYSLNRTQIFLPTIPLAGEVDGLSWGNFKLPEPEKPPYAMAAGATPEALWKADTTSTTPIPNGRQRLATLEEIEAPYPALQDGVDEAFYALRKKLGERIGWDFLATLDNAYVPLTSPAMPALNGNWLYTGRGIALNTVPVSAGWMAVKREDFGDQTYWRIYLRARRQDGSMGRPLAGQTWDFSARYTGDTRGYEEGGLPGAHPPEGYWVDFTAMARAYGWERMASASTWRSFYPATRLNEYALTGGLDWRAAILEIYPPEMLITPTPVSSPTITPTPTLTFTPTRWPTRTPRPTSTPWPSRTPSPTVTPTITLTPTASNTPNPAPVGR